MPGQQNVKTFHTCSHAALTPLLNDPEFKTVYLNRCYRRPCLCPGAPPLVHDLFKLQMLTVKFSVGLGGDLHWAKATVPFCDQ